MDGLFSKTCILGALGGLLLCSFPQTALGQLPEEGDESAPVNKRGRGARGLRPVISSAPNIIMAPPPVLPSGGVTAPAPAGIPPGGTPLSPSARDDLPLPGALPGEKEFTECKRIPANKRFVVNLKPDSELADLVGWIKNISCRPFIIPSSIRQSKVTIVVPEAINASEAYRIFLSALESMGLTVQPDGKVLKLIESNRARESSIPVIGPGEEPPSTEQFVTKMLRLSHVYPDEILTVLNRLKGRDGDIQPYAATNTLIITDLASNIKRMEAVVRALDVPMGGEKIWLIRLRNVAAGDVSTMLQQIFGVGKAAPAGSQARRAPVTMTAPNSGTDITTPGLANSPTGSSDNGDLSISQIVPDERTNSLIVVATERTYQRVLALVKRLEAQGEGMGGERVHVYGLANASAEDLSVVLQGIGVSVSGGGARRGGTPGRPAGASPPQGGGSAGLFQEEVKVTADKATNSLVILAGGKDYLTIKDVIKQLDLPRKQVFIEATVMEISLSKSLDLGISYHAGYDLGNNNGLVLGGLHNGTLNSLNPLGAAALSGLAAGVVGPLFSSSSTLGSLGSSIPTFGALIQALQTNSDVNVLQVPSILTTDNEKATIQVGQNLPFPSTSFAGIPTGTSGGAAGGLGIGTSVQRQDVALKLEITPHVNNSDVVRLEIDNEISDVASPNYNGLGPATNKRTLKTTAVVRDQQPIVLGGILRDKISETVTKIPLLGDIPILGYLFKIKNKTVDKQMLMVVLTPYVITEPGDLRRIFERKMKERREFIETYSAFANERDFDKVVDFTRKRGALEEINRTAIEAEKEANELHAAEAGLRHDVEGGPVELPAQPLRGASSPTPQPASPSLAPVPNLSLPPPPSSPSIVAPSGAPPNR